MTLPTQLVAIETRAGGFSAIARASNREHQASASSPDLAARLAAAGLHGLSLSEVQSCQRESPGLWKVTFKYTAFKRRSAA